MVDKMPTARGITPSWVVLGKKNRILIVILSPNREKLVLEEIS
jgi:hypothetical protein